MKVSRNCRIILSSLLNDNDLAAITGSKFRKSPPPMTSYFFIVFIFTVILTRVVLYIRPTPSPTIRGFRVHHYMYGIAGVALALLIHSITLYAVGLGLFVDELTYLLIRGKDHKDNYSRTSLLGTALCVLIVFLTQGYLLIPFGDVP